MSEWYYLSCRSFTVAVEVKGGEVVDGPPIVCKFIGQPSQNLGCWMRRIGQFKGARLK